MDNPSTQEEYGHIHQQLQAFEERTVAGKQICGRVRWKIRDMVSKEFFKAVQERLASSALMALRDDTGQMVHD